jgi:glycolate oxidase iron-sulfur subunit
MSSETIPNPPAPHDAPAYGDLLNCMHCGLCLPTCPTYALSGRERSSPRGRIALMKGVADHRLELSDLFGEEMYFCLGCLACQTACPAGVPYGSMLEAARSQIEQERSSHRESLPRRLARRVRGALRRIPFVAFEHLWLMRLGGRALYLYQRCGPRALVRALHLLPGRLKEMERLLPALPRRYSSATLAAETPAVGPARGRVGILLGCAMDVFCTPENEATVRVLTKAGWTVAAPKSAGCCGALHAHAGDLPRAREQARRVIAAFEAAGVDAVVLNSAGCGAAMKDYAHWLADDPAWHERAADFSAKVCDLSEWLDAHPLPTADLRTLDVTITYHDACHLAHAQGVTDPPRRVLSALPGVRLTELPESTWCCGSAGIYNVTHFSESVQLLDRKMANVAATGVQVVVTGNPGCLLQLRYGIARAGLDMEAIHTVELLDRALR